MTEEERERAVRRHKTERPRVSETFSRLRIENIALDFSSADSISYADRNFMCVPAGSLVRTRDSFSFFLNFAVKPGFSGVCYNAFMTLLSCIVTLIGKNSQCYYKCMQQKIFFSTVINHDLLIFTSCFN